MDSTTKTLGTEISDAHDRGHHEAARWQYTAAQDQLRRDLGLAGDELDLAISTCDPRIDELGLAVTALDAVIAARIGIDNLQALHDADSDGYS